MKKLYIFAIFLIIISGCSTDKQAVFLPFEKTENIVSENITTLQNNIKQYFKYPNYSTSCSFLSDNDSINLKTFLSVSGFIEKDFGKNSIALYNYFSDKKGNKGFIFSGNIENLSIKDKRFINFINPIIDLGKGNYESNFWFLITQNLSNKRISYDSKKLDDLKEKENDINFVLNTLFSSSNFQNNGQVTYEGNTAYKISLKPEILDFINNQTNIQIKNMEGLFIILGEDEVVLKITDMNVSFSQKKVNIIGIISDTEIFIDFNTEKGKINLFYKPYKKYNELNITKYENYQEIRSIKTSLSKQKNKEPTQNTIKGEIFLSPNLIYGSDLEKEIKINIKCLYENFSGENLQVKEPDSYILLDQVLGDEFSIKSFIGNQ